MDQKTPTNLDPKLKEAYDRVMGTLDTTVPSLTPQPKTDQPQAVTPPAPPQPVMPSSPLVPPSLSAPPQAPIAPPVQAPQPVMPPIAPTATDQAAAVKPTIPIPSNPTTAPPSSSTKLNNGTTFVAGSDKKKFHLPPVLIALGVVVFFLIYTLVWLVVFKVKLPFLPF